MEQINYNNQENIEPNLKLDVYLVLIDKQLTTVSQPRFQLTHITIFGSVYNL